MEALQALVDALHKQTAAIDRLVEINHLLLAAMAESDDEESLPAKYLDGTPVL